MRRLQSKPNVSAPDSTYPNGRIKDDTGSNDGTEVDEQVYGDSHQFFEQLMAQGGLTPNDQPENTVFGFQLNEALYNLAVRPQLAYLGTFSEVLSDQYEYTSPASVLAIDADSEFLYAANFNGSIYSVDRWNIKTGVGSGFIPSVVNIGSIAIDETYVWIFLDGASKSIVAYFIATGLQDATKTIALAVGTYGTLRSANGSLYIADNTNNEIKTFLISTVAATTPIGSALANVSGFTVNERWLWMVSDANTTVSVFDSATGNLIRTFSASTSYVEDIESIEEYAGRLYILKSGGTDSKIEIFDAGTELQLKNLYFGTGASGRRSLRIANNKQFTLESLSLNAVTVYNQEFKH